MAVKIRLQRHGARNHPFYRLVVADARSPRDGRFIEVVGQYNPTSRKRADELKVKVDRVDYWLNEGAQPTDTARSLINRARREPVAQLTVNAVDIPTEPAAEIVESAEVETDVQEAAIAAEEGAGAVTVTPEPQPEEESEVSAEVVETAEAAVTEEAEETAVVAEATETETADAEEPKSAGA